MDMHPHLWLRIEQDTGVERPDRAAAKYQYERGLRRPATGPQRFLPDLGGYRLRGPAVLAHNDLE